MGASGRRLALLCWSLLWLAALTPLSTSAIAIPARLPALKDGPGAAALVGGGGAGVGLAGPARLGSGSGSGSGPGGNHRDGSSKDIAAGKDGGSGIEGQNYLISLDRKITRKQEDAVLDKIMKSGAVVRDLFDYRVFKGILFSVGKTGDKGLSAWESTLASLQGVKSVEEDSVVHVAGA